MDPTCPEDPRSTPQMMGESRPSSCLKCTSKKFNGWQRESTVAPSRADVASSDRLGTMMLNSCMVCMYWASLNSGFMESDEPSSCLMEYALSRDWSCFRPLFVLIWQLQHLNLNDPPVRLSLQCQPCRCHWMNLCWWCTGAACGLWGCLTKDLWWGSAQSLYYIYICLIIYYILCCLIIYIHIYIYIYIIYWLYVFTYV